MKTDTTKKVIGDLIETLEDGRKGFGQAADKIAESGQTDIAASLRTFGDQRADFAAELRQLAADQGIELDGNGSMAGAMHRGWISLKDALTGDDPHAVLAAAETGEDHAVGEYRDALNQELPGPVRSVISRQATAVQSVHDNVRTLRDSTVS